MLFKDFYDIYWAAENDLEIEIIVEILFRFF